MRPSPPSVALRSLALTVLVATVVAAACTSSQQSSPTTAAQACPTRPDPAGLATAPQLRQMNAVVADLGSRPTGSAAHQRYIDWIEQQLHRIPGVKVAEQPFTIQRWTPGSASLALRTGSTWTDLPVADAIPYSHPTGPPGTTAPLTFVPDGSPITAANARGRVVVRPAPPGSVAQSVFFLPLVTYSMHDPHHTISRTGTFYGDFLNYDARVTDLRDAGSAGAAGLVFVKDLPRRQLLGHSEPYEGEAWDVPGVWLGADEGARLTTALASGQHPLGRITVTAGVKPVVTASVSATIPGQSASRLVVDSHTDGTNAVEDNGPVAMIAMARYLARLPLRCRPRTIDLAFSTGHFYQRLVSPTTRNGGAEALAEQLDKAYDGGSVSAVVAVEHLGAIDYEGVARRDGPGKVLEPTGQPAMQQIFVTPSPPLVHAVEAVVGGYHLDRTAVMKGADAPGATSPAHCSFGGEGTPFDKHLLPTIGIISAPQSLYDPVFGLEGIDFDVMRAETLAYTDLLLRLGRLSRPAVAGSVPAERAKRAAGAAGCP
jgi:hypothetical protein